MHEMTKHYLTCMLWAETDEDGDPLDAVHSIHFLPKETIDKAERDCLRFIEENKNDIGDRWEQAGHDFWLTRNGHGAGFWDGDWPAEVGDRLTESATSFKECYPYIGDDGKVYLSQCI